VCRKLLLLSEACLLVRRGSAAVRGESRGHVERGRTVHKWRIGGAPPSQASTEVESVLEGGKTHHIDGSQRSIGEANTA
jgi:hypothetical protein